MGNSDVRQMVEVEEISFGDVGGSLVTVDGYNWLYKYMTTTVRYSDSEHYTGSDGEEYPAVLGALKGIPKFIRNDITPVVILDGGYHDLKEDEIEERRDRREESKRKAKIAEESGDEVLRSKYESRSKYLDSRMLNSCKELFSTLDVPYMTAPGAAEAQAAHMCQSKSRVDHVISDDYDAVLFGSPSTIRNFTSSRQLERIRLRNSLDSLSMTRRQLVEATILCGTDYNEGVHGFGPKTSVSSIKDSGGIEEVTSDRDIEVENAEEIVSIFMEPEVTNNFSLPNGSLEPDIEETRRLCVDKIGLNEEEVNRILQKIERLTSQANIEKFSG